MSSFDTLPKSVKELITLIGFKEAMLLVRRFPGVSLDIPKGKTVIGKVRHQQLIELIGAEATAKLVGRWGGDRLRIPRCHDMMIRERWLQIVSEYNAGATARELALRHSLTDRAIWKILKKPVPLDEFAQLNTVRPFQKSLF